MLQITTKPLSSVQLTEYLSEESQSLKKKLNNEWDWIL